LHIFAAQYQTVQVAAQTGMMTLQDGSQVVQTSVANVQMPLFAQQAGKRFVYMNFFTYEGCPKSNAQFALNK